MRIHQGILIAEQKERRGRHPARGLFDARRRAVSRREWMHALPGAVLRPAQRLRQVRRTRLP